MGGILRDTSMPTRHFLALNTALLLIDRSIHAMDQSINMLLFLPESLDMDKLQSDIQNNKDTIVNNLSVVRKHSLGNKVLYNSVAEDFKSLFYIEDTVLELFSNGKRAEAAETIKGTYLSRTLMIKESISELDRQSTEKVKEFLSTAESIRSSAVSRRYLLFFVAAMVSFVAVVLIVKSFTRSISELR